MQPEVEYTAPDPSTKITWPRNLAGQVDDSRFIIVWPNNINSKKTIQNGRRVGLEDACENPIVQEMSEVCQYLRLTHIIEPYKALPRDLVAYPGRLKVQLLDAQSEPANPEVPNRKALMRKMGQLIPRLTIRKQREAQRAKCVTTIAHSFSLHVFNFFAGKERCNCSSKKLEQRMRE